VARSVVVRFVDDLDGTEGADVTSVRFGLDGVDYEIDLSGDNAQRLRDSLAPFVQAARRTGGRRAVSGPLAKPRRTKAELTEIRVWARENGHSLAERGRIPGSVLNAYDAR
jgi:hypothetical protein